MSADNVTPIRPGATDPPSGLDDIRAQLALCRQTLQCASLALGQAEDEQFEGDSGPAAIRVVERCVDDLAAIEALLPA